MKTLFFLTVLAIFASEIACRRVFVPPKTLPKISGDPNPLARGPLKGPIRPTRDIKDTSTRVLPTHRRPQIPILPGQGIKNSQHVQSQHRAIRDTSPQLTTPRSTIGRVPLVSSLAQTPKREFPVFDANGVPSIRTRKPRDTNKAKTTANTEKGKVSIQVTKSLIKDPVSSVHSKTNIPAKPLPKAVHRHTRDTKGQPTTGRTTTPQIAKSESDSGIKAPHTLTKDKKPSVPPVKTTLGKDHPKEVHRHARDTKAQSTTARTTTVKAPHTLTKDIKQSVSPVKTTPVTPKDHPRVTRETKDIKYQVKKDSAAKDSHIDTPPIVKDLKLDGKTRVVRSHTNDDILRPLQSHGPNLQTFPRGPNKTLGRKTRDTKKQQQLQPIRPVSLKPDDKLTKHEGPLKSNKGRHPREITEEEFNQELDSHIRVARRLIIDPPITSRPGNKGSPTRGPNKNLGRGIRDTTKQELPSLPTPTHKDHPVKLSHNVPVPTDKGLPASTPGHKVHNGPVVRNHRDVKGEGLEGIEPGNARWRRAVLQPQKPIVPSSSRAVIDRRPHILPVKERQ